MEQNHADFVLDPRCRLCRSPDASGGRTSVYENDCELHQLVTEMISNCTALKIYDHDRLPQHVCGRCLEKLRETYALWKKCIAAQQDNAQCQKGKEEEYYRCRICHVEECEELYSVDYPGRDGEVLIGDILKEFANVTVLPGDGLAPYVCNVCLDQVERAGRFKRECLQAEEAFLSDTIHAWEKMEFQDDQPSHLVVELFAKPIYDTPKLVRCSVCGLKQSAREIKKHCDGCKLDFCDQERSDSISERDSPVEAINECQADEEIELLLVVDSSNEEELDSNGSPVETPIKRRKVMNKKRDLTRGVTTKSAAKANKNGQEDPNAVPASGIALHLSKQNQKIEDHFQIVSSPPDATHQTMRLKTFLCCGCNRFLQTDEVFRKHLREYHAKPTIRSEYVCGICNSSFESEKLFLAHKDKLGGRLYNYCKICDIVLLEERSFVRHQMLNHLTDRQLKDIEKQFVKNVSQKCRLVQSVPDGVVSCDDCGKSFASEKDLFGHRYENFQFSCQQKNCNYVTNNREFMIVHCVIGDHSLRESSKRTRPKELTTSIFEEPPKVSKTVVEEDTFEVELEDGIDDADPDWQAESDDDSDWVRPDSVKRVVKLPPIGYKPPKPQDENSVHISSTRASLENRSLTMEDMFETLESTPSGTHQLIRRKTPFCCGCNRFFISDEAFLKHRESVHPKTETDSNLSCHVCRTTFSNKKNLQCHIDKKDCNVYNYCIPCDRVMLDEKSFVRHQLRKHMTRQQRAKFEQQIATVTVKKCTYHSRTSYAGLTSKQTDWRCTFCRRYFTTQADMDGHMSDAIEYRCLAEGCEISSKHRLIMIVHCSLGDHRKQPRSELKELNFRKKAMLFDDALPVAAERVDDLSQAVIPTKKLRAFLKGNSLQMEDIFEVLQDIDNSFTKVLKLRRKKPMCCACNMMFMSEQALSNHMQKEHTQRPSADDDPELVCKMCYTVFKNRTLLLCHTNRLKMKHSTYSYCKLCDSIRLGPSFTRHNVMRHLTDAKLSELETHFTTVSSHGCRDADSLSEINEGKFKYSCKCGKKFGSLLSAKAHQAGTHDVMLYCKVEGCRFQTSKKLDMYEHCMEEAHEVSTNISDQESDEEKISFPERQVVQYKCCVSKCPRKYAIEESLLSHFASAHGPLLESLEANTCPNCRETFSNDEEFRDHMDRRQYCKMFKCINAPCKYQSESLPRVQLHYKSCKKLVPSKAWKCPKEKIPDHFAKVGQLDEMIDIIEGIGSFCCGCRRVVGSEAELQEHLRQEHATRDPSRPVHCPTCNKGFKLRSFLENHVRESTERRYYHCRICKMILINELQIKHHKTYVHAFDDPSDLSEFYDTITSDLLPCCGCNAKFETQDELAIHCLQTHPVPASVNRLMCPNCHMEQPSLKGMSSHCAMYGSKVYYKCKIGDCNLQTKVLSKIQRHVSAASHEDQGGSYRKYLAYEETLYCCVSRCNFSSESYDLLIDHGMVEHAQEREIYSAQHRNRPVTCPVCCKGFDGGKHLTNHRNGAIIVTCEICGNKARIPDYPAHLEECKKTYSRTCSKCPEVFSDHNAYRRHYQRLHENKKKTKKKVICNICGVLVTDCVLQDHIAQHENKREWKCKQCTLAFNTKTMLSLHGRRVHTTERKYHCQVEGCDKTYRYNVDRVRHEMVVHFNDKPFACSECSESFVRNRDLQLHLRQHTGRKLYSCQRCRAEFDRKSEFVAHQERCESRADGDCTAYEEFIVEELV